MNRTTPYLAAVIALLSSALLVEPLLARDYTYCDWVNGVLRCQSKGESEHYLTRSLCGYSDIESKCVTKSYEKVPATESSVERAGSATIMRGGTPSKLRELPR